MARSRLPLSVSAGGASSSIRACSSLSAGVRPSLALVTFGRFTPFTGLWTTALRSHRYSNSDDTAESFRRIVEPSHPLLSRSLRQAIRWGIGKELCNFSDSLVLETPHSGFAQKRT